MRFDQEVARLLEDWDKNCYPKRNFSDPGNIAQLPQMPAVAQPTIPGELFPPKARKRKSRDRK